MSYRVGEATHQGSSFVTDGSQFGTVVAVYRRSVLAKDMRTFKQFSIAIATARPMTYDEVIEYNATPAIGDPTQDEIRERSAAERDKWKKSKQERKEHAKC